MSSRSSFCITVLLVFSAGVRADLFFDLTGAPADERAAAAVPRESLAGSKGEVSPAKTTPGVRALYEEFVRYRKARGAGQAVGEFFSAKTMAVLDGEGVVVDISAYGDARALAADLEALGMTRVYVFGQMVSGTLPIAALPAAEALRNLRFMRLATPHLNAGSVTSQGDASMRTDDARAALAVDGSGRIVGVLSDSYDCFGGVPDANDDVASGDLPPDVNVLLDMTPGSGCVDEGRAMLQLVHDVAPGAGLAFHSAFIGGQAGFARGIVDLADPAKGGADVIVDDVIYFAEPMFMDGIVAQAADTVAAAGVLYFSSAGNVGRSSQEEAFRPGNTYSRGDFAGAVPFWGGTAHDFDPGPGIDEFQRIRLDDLVTVLQWSDPFPSVTGVDVKNPSDLDLYIFNDPPTTVLASSAGVQTGAQDPVELISASGSGRTYNVMIVKFAGPDPTRIKRVDFGASVLEHGTNSPTCYGHANAAGAIAVGAAAWFETPEFGADPPELEPFSSAGGVPILFDATGNPVSVKRRKPEMTAPDGTNTTFFGVDIAQDDDTFPNFFGTSAAVSHAAGLAALMLETFPRTPNRLFHSALSAGCDDIVARSNGVPLDSGFDPDSGAGLVQARPEAFGLADLTSTTVGPYDFEPWSGTTVGSSSESSRSILSFADLPEAIATLDLPSGALVELFELEACDDSATGAVDAQLLICPVLSEFCEIAVSTTTGASDAAGCTNNPVYATPLTIDNLNNAYFFSIIDPDLSDATRWGRLRVYWRRQISPAPGTATFLDVPIDHQFFQEIEALASSGITRGCGRNLFCPSDTVTRGQMAALLARAFGLHFAP